MLIPLIDINLFLLIFDLSRSVRPTLRGHSGGPQTQTGEDKEPHNEEYYGHCHGCDVSPFHMISP